MNLEDIGFYTLSEERAKKASIKSPIARAELILTDKCNLRCPYCRGLREDLRGEMSLPYAKYVIGILGESGLRNIRFSGGEPTLYPFLEEVVTACKKIGVQHIAISTNGTAPLDYYKNLIKLGVNDFSISLDSGCCSIGKDMTGGNESAWFLASHAISRLSKLTHVTVGSVFNECNVDQVEDTILWIDSLNPSDIRIIPSAQYNKAINKISLLPFSLISKYPILYYRVHNMITGIPFRGIQDHDSHLCGLALDDLAIANIYQFPCIIYMREGGNPISEFDGDFRQKRSKWFLRHDTHKDEICSKNCLDVCVHYNNSFEGYRNEKKS